MFCRNSLSCRRCATFLIGVIAILFLDYIVLKSRLDHRTRSVNTHYTCHQTRVITHDYSATTDNSWSYYATVYTSVDTSCRGVVVAGDVIGDSAYCHGNRRSFESVCRVIAVPRGLAALVIV